MAPSPATSPRIELFLREPSLPRISSWFTRLLPDPSYQTRLTFTPHAFQSDFTSVEVRAHTSSLDAFARAAFAAFGVETRFRPGPLAPHATPYHFVSISAQGERLLSWWTPDDISAPSRFLETFAAAGARPRNDLLADLLARYAESHRAYHTLLHLSEMVSESMNSTARPEHPHEVDIALWFHDAIYDTRRNDNEERSADWARDELLAGGAAPDVAARVHALVLATKHRAAPEDHDARFLVDADLAILAATPDRFAAYECQVRTEYEWVPEPQFQEARARFLRGMLARPSIFSLPATRELHEAHAVRNLEVSLRRLESGAP